MKLQPLIPEFRDPRQSLVKVYQSWLVSQGAKLKPDGKFGNDTLAAAATVKLPAEVEVPPICMWVDRSWTNVQWMQKSLRSYDAKFGFAPDRIGLFLGGIENGATFKPFVDRSRLIEMISWLNGADIAVDLTVWAWPSKTYLEDLAKYVTPILNQWSTARLDLDCESAWGSGSTASCTTAAKLIAKLFPDASRLSINDYASIQADTRLLFRPGVARRPQAYSVGYVKHGGPQKDTTKDSVYWPGETQAYAMKSSLWGDASDGPLDIGLAAYKPVTGMSVNDQVVQQVRSALWHNPRELWFWQLKADDKYLAALGSLQGG